MAPNKTMESRISRFSCRIERSGHNNRLNPFQLNIEATDRIEELKLEVTAPTIAPNPRRATTGGVTYSKSIGNVCEGCAWRRANKSEGQAYLKAATPRSAGG